MFAMERSSQVLELYTIPSYSSWFSWINIHEVERFSLREFFDGSSITRSPRIYKEYRDFIISKYREDPSRKLSFTEVRKSLVGDVSVLHKVFTFLEKWGLINFNVGEGDEKGNRDGGVKLEEEEENGRGKVKVEEGAPYGVRVVAAPNSMKPVVAPPLPPSVVVNGGGFAGEVGENGFKWPSLASYSDVYGDLMQQNKKGLKCGICEDICDSAHYEYTKEEDLILCEKCFKSGNYKENESADDFKLIASVAEEAVWTEAETLLLLESISKHGDDWNLVAKDVKTKSRLDCISKLIQLPFGDLMLGEANKNNRYLDIVDSSKKEELASHESRDSGEAEDKIHEVKDNEQENGDTETAGSQPKELSEEPTSNKKPLPKQLCEVLDDDPPAKQCEEPKSDEGPPSKRLCKEQTTDNGSSLMKQVARISTMVGPQVTASAAEAAVTALCFENQCSREIFDDNDDDNNSTERKASSPATSDEKSASDNDVSIQEEKSIQLEPVLKSIILPNLRTRAAAATALGAAAANAKLLADQEERDIEHLVAVMIEAQLKKLHRKLKYFEDLEFIMQKESTEIEELEESLVAERLNVLKKVCDAGINKSKEIVSVTYQFDNTQ